MATKRAKKAGRKVTKARPKVLRCMRGYEFKKLRGNTVALMRNNSAGVTLNCECDLSGGCKVTIDPHDPQTISCLNGGCTGACGWIINIPGIRGVAILRPSRA